MAVSSIVPVLKISYTVVFAFPSTLIVPVLITPLPSVAVLVEVKKLFVSVTCATIVPLAVWYKISSVSPASIFVS